MAYSDAEGELAVRIARDAIEGYVTHRPIRSFTVPAHFNEKAGAFVTINTPPEALFRGCFGYPSPFFPLIKALVKASEGACEDPRFPPLGGDEVGRVIVEVSLLTRPQALE